MTTKEKETANERMERISGTIVAAENTRCACGYTGDWSEAIHGTSGPAQEPCVWAGCPNCGGSAIGVPMLLTDWRWIVQQSEAAVAVAHEMAVARRLAQIADGVAPADLGPVKKTWRGYEAEIIGPNTGVPVGRLEIDVADEVTRARYYV